MAEAAARRRLAAILAADVVGYSRLMETAEAATLARLKAHRAELIDPLLAAHGGRLIKLMGDGALVEFPSVVEAVACASTSSAAWPSARPASRTTKRIRFRIGINLGDVLIDGDDLYGDGVNIAARLEGLAEPGGIVLSAAAFDQVSRQAARQRSAISASDTLKNIARPVRVYAIGDVARRADSSAARTRRWPVAGGVRSRLVADGGRRRLFWASQEPARRPHERRAQARRRAAGDRRAAVHQPRRSGRCLLQRRPDRGRGRRARQVRRPRRDRSRGVARRARPECRRRRGRARSWARATSSAARCVATGRGCA